MTKFYKFEIYIPENDVNKLKIALFKIGVGKMGNYDSCCWQTLGVGQFRPLEGAQPAIGQLNKIEYVNEIKLEFICDDALINQVIQTIKEEHPYECPAYHYFGVKI